MGIAFVQSTGQNTSGSGHATINGVTAGNCLCAVWIQDGPGSTSGGLSDGINFWTSYLLLDAGVNGYAVCIGFALNVAGGNTTVSGLNSGTLQFMYVAEFSGVSNFSQPDISGNQNNFTTNQPDLVWEGCYQGGGISAPSANLGWNDIGGFIDPFGPFGCDAAYLIQSSAGTISTPFSSGSGEGDVVQYGLALFPAPVLPTVTTQAATSIATTTATGNGNLTATGGANATLEGFVYDTSSHGLPGNVAPASSGYANNVSTSGSFGTGTFTDSLTGLDPSTTYYVRAFTENTAGYAYGGEVSFTTAAAGPNSIFCGGA